MTTLAMEVTTTTTTTSVVMLLTKHITIMIM